MAIFWDYNNGYIERKRLSEARHAWEHEQPVMLLANKANPESPYFKPWEMTDKNGNIYVFVDKKKAWEIVGKLDHARDFDCMVKEFEYYNCGAELGNYASFYTMVGGVTA